MNSWEINKIAGAVVGTLAFALGISVISEVIFHEDPPAEPGYAVAIPEDDDTQVAEAPKETPFAVLLANADPSAGENDARVCGACHSFNEGGPTKVGPNLYNIVGNDMLHVAGYSYSNALQAFGAGKKWTYDELNQFLENPQGYIPGTSMAYAGIKNPETRADVIAYLRSISPDAPPLPEPPAETEVAAADPAATGGAATDAAPAGDDAAAFAAMVAAADPSAGEADARVCGACHSFNEGGPTKVGPNLYGIVGAPILHVSDYNYSPALTAYGQEHGNWTIALLDEYLENPMGAVPGTRMAYAGIKDTETRAAVIAYLRSISPDAPPIDTGSTPATAAAPDASETATDAAARGGGTSPAAGDDGAGDSGPAAAGDGAAAAGDGGAAAGDDGSTAGDGQRSDAPTAGDGDTADATTAGDSAAAGGTDAAVGTDGASAAGSGDQAAANGVGDAAQSGDTQAAASGDAGSAAPATADGESQVAAATQATGDASTGDPSSIGSAGDAAAGGDELAAFVGLVRAADPSNPPANVTAVCQACHTVTEGGETRVGPNLWNVVGGSVLHVKDFAYSDAFKAFAADHPVWTIAELDKYLADPMGYIPGTKMAFAGVKDEKERAAVIAWLRSLSNDPVSLDNPQVVGTFD